MRMCRRHHTGESLKINTLQLHRGTNLDGKAPLGRQECWRTGADSGDKGTVQKTLCGWYSLPRHLCSWHTSAEDNWSCCENLCTSTPGIRSCFFRTLNRPPHGSASPSSCFWRTPSRP